MIYKITAHTPSGDDTIMVEGKSRVLILLNAQSYFRRKYGSIDNCNDNFTMTWEEER